MEELAEIYGGEVPEEGVDLHDEVRSFYHKKANGPLDLQINCLIAVVAGTLLPPPAKPKPTKKSERAVV